MVEPEKNESKDDDLVWCTWKENVDKNKMTEVYKALGLFESVNESDQLLHLCKRMRTVRFWLYKFYEINKILFCAFYRNISPFVVLVVPSAMLISENF